MSHRYGHVDEVRQTLGLLRWYRDFIASDFDEAHDPEYRCGAPAIIGKEYAVARLRWLIHVAINRKSGLWPQGVEYRAGWLRHPRNRGRGVAVAPLYSQGLGPLNHHGEPARRAESEHWWRLKRDQQRLRRLRLERVRVCQFETPEVDARLGHLKSERDEW